MNSVITDTKLCRGEINSGLIVEETTLNNQSQFYGECVARSTQVCKTPKSNLNFAAPSGCGDCIAGAERFAPFHESGTDYCVTPSGYLEPSIDLGIVHHFLCPDFISGNNGSWTNTDDMPPKKGNQKPQQKAPVFKVTDKQARKLMRSLADQLGATGGAMLASGVGAPMASQTMGKAGKVVTNRVLDYLIGPGKYTVVGTGASSGRSLTNSLLQNPSMMGPSVVFQPIDARVTVCEFAGTITTPASTGFTDTTHGLSACNALLFPWACTSAMLYECMKIRGFAVEFRGTATQVSTTGSIPEVVISHEINPNLDKPFISFPQAASNNGALVVRADQTGCYFVECSAKENPLSELLTECGPLVDSMWMISGALNYTVPSMSRFFTRLGCVHIGVNVSSAGWASTAIGDIRIKAEIEFSKPRLGAMSASEFHLYSVTASAAKPFGTQVSKCVCGGLLMDTYADLTTGVCYLPGLPVGSVVLVTLVYSGSSVTLATPSITPVGCQLIAGFFGSTSGSSVFLPPASTVTTGCMLHFPLQITTNNLTSMGSGNARFTISGGTLPTSSGMDLQVTLLNCGTMATLYGKGNPIVPSQGISQLNIIDEHFEEI